MYCTVPVAAPGVWIALRALSTLTQNLLDRQDTEFRAVVPSMLTGAFQLVPLYPTMLPSPSTAAQNLALGHDTAFRYSPESMTAGVAQLLPL
jgi:hypothetical protein